MDAVAAVAQRLHLISNILCEASHLVLYALLNTTDKAQGQATLLRNESALLESTISRT